MMETFDCCWDRTALEKNEGGSPKMKVGPNMKWTGTTKIVKFCSPEKTAHISSRHRWFPAKWRLKNEGGNSVPMTGHYADLGGISDWLQQSEVLPTSGLWHVISMEFLGETSGGLAKCRLFPQAEVLRL